MCQNHAGNKNFGEEAKNSFSLTTKFVVRATQNLER